MKLISRVSGRFNLFNGVVLILFIIIILGLQVIAMSERSSTTKHTADGGYMVSLICLTY